MSTLKGRAVAWVMAGLGTLLAAGQGLAVKEALGGRFRYDVGDLRKVDPELVLYKEVGALKPDVGALRGIAVASDDKVIVAGDAAWAVLDKGGESVFRAALKEPASCVAAGPEGEVYLGMGNRIVVVDASRMEQATWLLEPGALITSIAVTDEDVYAADVSKRVVLRFNRVGELQGRLAVKDKERGVPGLIIPSPYCDVVVDADESLWVVNPGRLALENYRSNGDLVTSWRKAVAGIEGFCGCCNPTHIARAPGGRFVTSEKGLVRVKLYSATGDFLGVVAGPDQFDEGTEGLDLAVDSGGRILVLDPKRGLIRIFVER